MSKKLKPCPFCGSPGVEHVESDSLVVCLDCTAEVKTSDVRSEVSAWNTRTDPVKEKLADALEEIMGTYGEVNGEHYYDDEAVNAAHKALIAYEEEKNS